MGNKRYDRRIIRRREAEERQAKHDALVQAKTTASLKRDLKQSAAGETADLGDFTQHVDDETAEIHDEL